MDFFTIMIILISLVVFVFIVLIAFVMKKSKDVENDAFLATERTQLLEKLSKKKKKLVPYKSNLYSLLTDAMTFTRVEEVRSIETSGFIYSKQQKPVIAFIRIERGKHATGQLVAISKKQRFVYEFQDQNVKFFCDDVALGTIDASGKIANAEKTVIGKLNRTNESTVITLQNTNLAELKKVPLYENLSDTTAITSVFEELNVGTSLLSLQHTPNEEEEKWLTALAIFEIAYFGIVRVA